MSLNRIVYTILVFPSYYSYQIVYLSAPLPLSLSPSFLFLFCAPDYLAKQLRDGLIFSRGGGKPIASVIAVGATLLVVSWCLPRPPGQ